MILEKLQVHHGKKKQRNNGKISHHSVIVAGAYAGIDRHKCINNEPQKQDHRNPGFLLNNCRVRFEGGKLL